MSGQFQLPCSAINAVIKRWKYLKAESRWHYLHHLPRCQHLFASIQFNNWKQYQELHFESFMVSVAVPWHTQYARCRLEQHKVHNPWTMQPGKYVFLSEESRFTIRHRWTRGQWQNFDETLQSSEVHNINNILINYKETWAHLVGLSHWVLRVIWFRYWIRPDAVLLSSQLPTKHKETFMQTNKQTDRHACWDKHKGPKVWLSVPSAF